MSSGDVAERSTAIRRSAQPGREVGDTTRVPTRSEVVRCDWRTQKGTFGNRGIVCVAVSRVASLSLSLSLSVVAVAVAVVVAVERRRLTLEHEATLRLDEKSGEGNLFVKYEYKGFIYERPKSLTISDVSRCSAPLCGLPNAVIGARPATATSA